MELPKAESVSFIMANLPFDVEKVVCHKKTVSHPALTLMVFGFNFVRKHSQFTFDYPIGTHTVILTDFIPMSSCGVNEQIRRLHLPNQ